MSERSERLDELASAYVDGEATIEERARVESDPALLARVEELRSVRDALVEPVVPPTATERDGAIRAALGAANVIDIKAARGQRRLRIASIAAAIVLVVGLAGVLIRAAGNDKTQKFSAVAASIGSTADSQATEAAAGAATATGSSAVGRPALGSFADQSSLVAATQTQVHNPAPNQSKQADTAAPTAAPDATTTTAPACVVPPPPDTANEVYAATAILQGHSVQVDVFTIADGSLVLVVTDAVTCTQVFSQPV